MHLPFHIKLAASGAQNISLRLKVPETSGLYIISYLSLKVKKSVF